ncbi:MAG: hypothetical protein E7184_01405 [Erysipelotrichaceae bacterium]|nr:hypothetical protein [Erysipelotrichaceae bacterium]
MASTRKDKYKELRSTIEEENIEVEVKKEVVAPQPKKKKVNLEDLDLDFLDEKNNELRPSEKLKKEQEHIYSTMEMNKVEVAENKAAKVLTEVTEKRPSKELKGTIIFKRVDNVSSEEKEKSQKRFVKESKKIDEQATRQISVKEVLDRSVKLDKTTKFDRMKNIKKDEKYQENNPALLVLGAILILAIFAIVLIVIATL